MPESIPQQVRDACAWVAERARFVEIDRAALAEYAPTLAEHAPALAKAASDLASEVERPARDGGVSGHSGAVWANADRERQAALVICLDVVNFGSGWWPTIRKREGHSGYATIAAGLTDRLRVSPWSARELTQLSAQDVARVLGQDPDHPLMGLYADALQDVGEHLIGDHCGRFSGPLDSAGGSAVALVDHLSRWRAFADVSAYEGREVPFYKRAQITAADVARAGLAELSGIERLTAFADNLVPHVLRIDGLLQLAPHLCEQIDAGELLDHGAPEEVELRACAVHAVELLAHAVDGRLCPAQIDEILWNRGSAHRYKAVERPRCRTTAY